MANWRYVAWCSKDPMNVSLPSTPLTGTVKASCRSDAFDKSMERLQKSDRHGEILNWYVEEVAK